MRYFKLILIGLFLQFNSYSQEKIQTKNIFLSSIGVQFSGDGDLTGSNYVIGYKRKISNFHSSISYERFGYKLYSEDQTRIRATNNFNAFIGYKLGDKNNFILEIGPYISFYNERIMNGLNTQFLLSTKDNGTIVIPPSTGYSYNLTTFGYSFQMKYLFKVSSNSKFGPSFQFQNDNYSTTVSSLRLGLEIGL